MYTVGHVTALFVSDVIWFFSLVWLWEIIHCFVWGCLNIVSLLTRQVDVCAIPFPHFHYFFSTSLPHYCLNLSCGRIFFCANLHRQQSSNRVGHSGGLQAAGTRTLILWLNVDRLCNHKGGFKHKYIRKQSKHQILPNVLWTVQMKNKWLYWRVGHFGVIIRTINPLL